MVIAVWKGKIVESIINAGPSAASKKLGVFVLLDVREAEGRPFSLGVHGPL